MSDIAGVRASAVAMVAVASTAGCVLLLRGWRALGKNLPDVPWVGIGPLLLLILVVLVAGWQVRRYARYRTQEGASRRAPQRVTPQRARGTLVAGQSAALGGGALVGWYLAIALVHLPNVDVVSVRQMVVRAAISALVALALAGAGLLTQHWCRLPPGENDDDEDEPPRGVSYVS
ncbi:DUF3180 domain-containing protein [Ornithinimicrobium cryptoxanthini]|uniref:DUF3180 domain-containing protein n=1 Tax=Ornithinimicrobium cryptoxanthini TaxID=2934161 RepID=UPI00211942CA|nr:DUF3180 domain-containing protein [Ornithinimicrobium cryptoxanthini]